MAKQQIELMIIEKESVFYGFKILVIRSLSVFMLLVLCCPE